MPLPRTIGTGRALIWIRRTEVPVVTGPVDVAATDPATLNPILWLKADAITPVADGTAISSWNDSSGNARHATQATAGKQPTYRTNVWNGKPTVRFVGAHGIGTAAVDLTAFQKMTWYIVGSATDQTTQILCEFSDNTTTQTTAAGAYAAIDTFSQLDTTVKGNSGIVGWKSGETFEGGTASRRLVHAILDMTRSHHETQAGVDGDTTGRRVGSAGSNTGFFGNHPFNIGCRDADASVAATSLFLTGDIAEVIVYTGRHTAAQRWGIERWLAEKWGVTAWSKPVANFVFEGDSITEGTPEYTHSYPQRLVNRLKDKVAWSLPAVSGETLNQMVADWATQIDPESALENFGDKNIATLFGGTNDMVSVGGNQSGATVAPEYLSYASDLKAAGFEVVAFTALPRSDTAAPADFETQRTAFNSGVRAGTSSYDVLLDIGADATIGDAGDELNTTYYDADKVHPNTRGRLYISGKLQDTLQTNYALLPTDITTIPDLVFHLDASAITPVADGTAISQWNDLSGNAYHAVQATGSKQPIYKTNILNGLPVVRFQGTDDALVTPNVSLASSMGFTLFTVFNSTVSATDQVVVEFGNNYNTVVPADGFLMYRNASNFGFINSLGNVGQAVYQTSGTITTTHTLFCGVQDRSKSSREATAWRNGDATGNRPNDTNNTNAFVTARPIYIGSRGGTSLFLTGDIAQILLYKRVLTGGERTRVEEMLALKWGLF